MIRLRQPLEASLTLLITYLPENINLKEKDLEKSSLSRIWFVTYDRRPILIDCKISKFYEQSVF